MSNSSAVNSAGDPPGWWSGGSMWPPQPAPAYGPIVGPAFSSPQVTISPTYAQTPLDVRGEIKCDGLKIGEVDIKTLVEQLTVMIPIFIPPESSVMEHEAVKATYKEYMDTRAKLVMLRDHLTLLIKLAEEETNSL